MSAVRFQVTKTDNEVPGVYGSTSAATGVDGSGDAGPATVQDSDGGGELFRSSVEQWIALAFVLTYVVTKTLLLLFRLSY